jgi:hypothetical protein
MDSQQTIQSNVAENSNMNQDSLDEIVAHIQDQDIEESAHTGNLNIDNDPQEKSATAIQMQHLKEPADPDNLEFIDLTLNSPGTSQAAQSAEAIEIDSYESADEVDDDILSEVDKIEANALSRQEYTRKSIDARKKRDREALERANLKLQTKSQARKGIYSYRITVYLNLLINPKMFYLHFNMFSYYLQFNKILQLKH